MIFASGHSIFWRLSDETGEGSDVVSVVLADQKADEIAEVEIETDITPALQAIDHGDSYVDIEWNKKDLELFLTLLQNTFDVDNSRDQVEQIELDLTDEAVLRIMHIVAAARFSKPFPGETIVRPLQSLPAEPVRFKIGEKVSLSTIDGFKSGVIVSKEDNNLICVLLEEITSPQGDNIRYDRHDLITLSKDQIFPASFCASQTIEDVTLH